MFIFSWEWWAEFIVQYWAPTLIAVGLGLLRKYKEKWASPLLYALLAFASVATFSVSREIRETVLSASQELQGFVRPPITQETAGKVIRDWCDGFEHSVKRLPPDDELVFSYRITTGNGKNIDISQRKDHPNYLGLNAWFIVNRPEVSAWSQERLMRFMREVRLELVRNGVVVTTVPVPGRPQIGISLMLPIGAGLTEYEFSKGVQRIVDAIIIADDFSQLLIADGAKP